MPEPFGAYATCLACHLPVVHRDGGPDPMDPRHPADGAPRTLVGRNLFPDLYDLKDSGYGHYCPGRPPSKMCQVCGATEHLSPGEPSDFEGGLCRGCFNRAWWD